MPINKVKSKSTSYSSSKSNKHKNILDILKKFKVSRSTTSFKKSQNNLPAHLMKLSSPKISQHYQTKHLSSKKFPLNSNSQTFSKSISSSYSSFTKNGETHSEGKKILNNSTKPFIEITEMENGNSQHFMIPKNTISYNSTNSTNSTKRKSTKSTKGKSTKGKSTKGKSTKGKSTKRKSTKSTKGKSTKSTKGKSTKRKSTKGTNSKTKKQTTLKK